MDFEVRPIVDADREWVRRVLADEWGGPAITTRGRILDAGDLPGFIAWYGDERLGLLTYHTDGESREIVSLNCLCQDRGAGTALLAAVVERARAEHWRRLWLITTNDNLDALGFYQKRNWRLVAIHRDALDESRQLKPSIPAIGEYGISVAG